MTSLLELMSTAGYGLGL